VSDEHPIRLVHLTRRQFLGAATGGLLLAACGDEGESGEDNATGVPTESSPAQSTSRWQYTDARGKTISLDRPPARVVAWVTLASALWDFGVRSTAIFGPSRTEDGARTPQTGRMELEGLPSLTNAYREVDLELELLASLNPDVLLIPAYSGTIWPLPQEEVEAIERIVPVVALGINKRPANEVIKDIGALAASLAAPRLDGSSDLAATARRDFDEASDALRRVATQKPDLSIIVFSLSAETVWMADWTSLADLRYFSDLGVNFLPRQEDISSEGYSGQLSWEAINTYETDAILLDHRPQWELAEEDRAGTWTHLPAVQANQLGAWRAEVILSYQGLAPVLQEMADQVNRFDQDIVEEQA
jgi:iron complex transport system substrate-binding protein